MRDKIVPFCNKFLFSHVQCLSEQPFTIPTCLIIDKKTFPNFLMAAAAADGEMELEIKGNKSLDVI